MPCSGRGVSFDFMQIGGLVCISCALVLCGLSFLRGFAAVATSFSLKLVIERYLCNVRSVVLLDADV